MAETFWSLVPPLVAIALALITKEVYSSLFIGIVVGALFVTGFQPIATLDTIVNDGLIASLADAWNVGILLFLVFLGIMVALMSKAGGTAAFGRWAQTHIHSRVGAQLATMLLGVMIFVDDYFNCLTVGSVMRPVTDANKVSRAKLAYIIDSTAAPICMIAPISSWAAAVTGTVEGMNGLTLFCKAIPYNFYSLLTIVMLLGLTFMKLDYGPMRRHELNAMNGDLFSDPDHPQTEDATAAMAQKGKTIDLVLPVAVLIVLCIIGLIYTGGFFSGTNFIEAFAGCDAATGLAWGSLLAVIFTVIYLLCRRTLSFKEIMACVPSGFIAMVAPIAILTLAWTLSGMTGMLGADVYIANLMDQSAASLANFLPAIIFLVAVGMAFSTGTSWGTFGILIPIVVKIFPADSTMLIIGISACLAGAVCGDHISPISDTTIMSSAGAECNHVNHIATQIPYALTVAAVSFFVYILAGFVQSAWICLPVGIVAMLAVLAIIKKTQKPVPTK